MLFVKWLCGLGDGLRCGWLVGGAVAEHGVEDVAASSGEADECGAHAFRLRFVSCRESGAGCWLAAECCEC